MHRDGRHLAPPTDLPVFRKPAQVAIKALSKYLQVWIACRDYQPTGSNVGVGFGIPVNRVREVVNRALDGRRGTNIQIDHCQRWRDA
jgi:hypothetical protein